MSVTIPVRDYVRAYAIRGRRKKQEKVRNRETSLIIYAKSIRSLTSDRYNWFRNVAASGMAARCHRCAIGAAYIKGDERETIINFRERSVSPHLASPLRLAADRNVMRAWRFICHCRSSFRATCRRHGVPHRETHDSYCPLSETVTLSCSLFCNPFYFYIYKYTTNREKSRILIDYKRIFRRDLMK